MVVVARRCRGKGVTSGGTTARVGWRCTPVWSTRNGKRTGVLSRRGQTRAPGCEKRQRGGWKGDGGVRRARAEVPVTARYGSLGDRCRYRVPVSSESVARSSLTSLLARSRRPGGMESGPPFTLAAGTRVGSIARRRVRALTTLSSATGDDRDDSRATLKGFDRPCQTWRHRHPGGWYPGSLVTWRNGSRRGYMGV